MYFDPEPKSRREDLYNFEEEYKMLHQSISKNERLIVIKGIRRTGKTSLMKVVYNELKCPKVYIDGRVITPKQGEIFSAILQGSIDALVDAFADLKIRNMLKELTIPFGIKFSISIAIKNFEKIDSILKKRKKKLVIFIDEAQKLRAGNIDGIIAYLFEHTKNIIMVIAGSEVGLLDKVIGRDANSDLYGRPKRMIEMPRLSKEKAIEFLKIGFKQARKKVSKEDIEKSVETFDGIIGWLTLFGYYSLHHGVEKAIDIVRIEGSKIVAKEIENFLSLRKEAKHRYIHIFKVLATPLRWIEIKRYVEAKEGKKINDKTITKYLHEMEKYGFIMHKNGKYMLADPMIKDAVNLLTTGK